MEMEKKILAAILSFLIPGLGHFYSRRWIRGIVVFFIYYLIAFAISESSIHFVPGYITNFPFIHIIIGFVVAWDAYKVAPTGHLMAWQTMLLISFIFYSLAILSIKSDNIILSLVFIITALYTSRIVYEYSRTLN